MVFSVGYTMAQEGLTALEETLMAEVWVYLATSGGCGSKVCSKGCWAGPKARAEAEGNGKEAGPYMYILPLLTVVVTG